MKNDEKPKLEFYYLYSYIIREFQETKPYCLTLLKSKTKRFQLTNQYVLDQFSPIFID